MSKPLIRIAAAITTVIVVLMIGSILANAQPRSRLVDPGPQSFAVASWYGPGLYGNTMACGGTLHPGSMVVAHRALRCGTKITFYYRGRSAQAVVQDRGPFVGGRTFDLGPGIKTALGFGAVNTVGYRYGWSKSTRVRHCHRIIIGRNKQRRGKKVRRCARDWTRKFQYVR